MRTRNRVVEGIKFLNVGHLPVFLSFMHRHLEKERPFVNAGPRGATVEFDVPVDLLQLTVDDKSVLKDITSVTLTYRRNS